MTISSCIYQISDIRYQIDIMISYGYNILYFPGRKKMIWVTILCTMRCGPKCCRSCSTLLLPLWGQGHSLHCRWVRHATLHASWERTSRAVFDSRSLSIGTGLGEPERRVCLELSRSRGKQVLLDGRLQKLQLPWKKSETTLSLSN